MIVLKSGHSGPVAEETQEMAIVTRMNWPWNTLPPVRPVSADLVLLWADAVGLVSLLLGRDATAPRPGRHSKDPTALALQRA